MAEWNKEIKTGYIYNNMKKAVIKNLKWQLEKNSIWKQTIDK